MKVYLAGGSSDGLRDQLTRVLKWMGFTGKVFDPRMHMLMEWDAVVAADLAGIRECDVLLAYFEDDNPGTGMFAEIGYAKGLGRTVVAIRCPEQNPTGTRRYDMFALQMCDLVFDTLHEAAEWIVSTAACLRGT